MLCLFLCYDVFNYWYVKFQVIQVSEYRAQLYDYLKNRMQAIAPNLTVLVGELVGARLIAHAGKLSCFLQNYSMLHWFLLCYCNTLQDQIVDFILLHGVFFLRLSPESCKATIINCPDPWCGEGFIQVLCGTLNCANILLLIFTIQVFVFLCFSIFLLLFYYLLLYYIPCFKKNQ